MPTIPKRLPVTCRPTIKDGLQESHCWLRTIASPSGRRKFAKAAAGAKDRIITGGRITTKDRIITGGRITTKDRITARGRITTKDQIVIKTLTITKTQTAKDLTASTQIKTPEAEHRQTHRLPIQFRKNWMRSLLQVIDQKH